MERIPVIIDTDPGVDDVLAILLALSSPELDVRAIIVSYGNTDAESCYSNILKLYQAIARHLDAHPDLRHKWPNFSGANRTILAIGATGPLEGDLHSAQYFHGRDGLGGLRERHPYLNVTEKYGLSSGHPQLQLIDKSGVDVALDILRSEPERSITYIVLGPMTTLAQVVRKDAETVSTRIGQVVVMGGALDVPGNTSPVAEFNFFADPYAVHELLTPPPGNPLSYTIPLERVIILTLDITTYHEMPFPTYHSLVDPQFSSPSANWESKPPLVQFTSAFLERTREIMLEFGKDAMELHDIAAVWCAIENPPQRTVEKGSELILNTGWQAVKRKFDIERTGELTRGMLVVDRRSDQGAYAPGVNRAKVQAELERHHFKPPKGTFLESNAIPAQVEVEDSAHAHPPHDVSTITQGLASASLDEEGGVYVVTNTPGPEKLLGLLLKRVWDVQWE
ncbi:nucleoside hydrolase [Abortiporus biennis]|nr:nucleoside hydrolase [Abortiporus biennis]